MSDTEILHLLRNPEQFETAFTQLLRKYSPVLYQHIYRLTGNHEDTDDVLQLTFIKAWKGLKNFRGDAQMYTWLYRIATNEALTFLRQRKSKKTIDLKSASDRSGDTWVDGNKLQQQLQQAIDTLPAKQKQVFIMRYFDEMPYESMEEIVGTSQGALKASYHHAVKKIVQFFNAI